MIKLKYHKGTVHVDMKSAARGWVLTWTKQHRYFKGVIESQDHEVCEKFLVREDTSDAFPINTVFFVDGLWQDCSTGWHNPKPLIGTDINRPAVEIGKFNVVDSEPTIIPFFLLRNASSYFMNGILVRPLTAHRRLTTGGKGPPFTGPLDY